MSVHRFSSLYKAFSLKSTKEGEGGKSLERGKKEKKRGMSLWVEIFCLLSFCLSRVLGQQRMEIEDS